MTSVQQTLSFVSRRKTYFATKLLKAPGTTILTFFGKYYLSQAACISKYEVEECETKVRNDSRQKPNQSYVYRSSNHYFPNFLDYFLFSCNYSYYKGGITRKSYGMWMTEEVIFFITI